MRSDSSGAECSTSSQVNPARPWLPVEIVVRIFQESNTFSDAIALASTSSYLRDVWEANKVQIARPVAKKQVLAFKEALLAVRCIELASQQVISLKSLSSDMLEASQNAENDEDLDLSTATSEGYPPPIDIAALTRESRPPSLSEIQSVFSLRHLVQCIIHLMANGNVNMSTPAEPYLANLFSGTPDSEIYLKRVHTAFYRILIISSVHSNAYLQPFLSPTPQARRFHRLFSEGMNEEERRSRFSEYRLYHVSQWDLQYLQQFPPYNHHANSIAWKIHKPCYGSVAEWLMRSIDEKVVLTRFERQGLAPYPSVDIQKAWRIQQSMIMLDCWWALNTFLVPNGAAKGLVNEEPVSEGVYIREKDGLPRYLRLTMGGEDDVNLQKDDQEGWIRAFPQEIKVILPGMYQPQLVTLPGKVSDSSEPGVYFVKASADGKKLVDIPEVLYQIQLEMGEVAPYSGYMREPQMELAFGSFIFREYLGVKFGTNVFTPTRPDWLRWPHFGIEAALWDVGKFIKLEWPLVKMEV